MTDERIVRLDVTIDERVVRLDVTIDERVVRLPRGDRRAGCEARRDNR